MSLVMVAVAFATVAASIVLLVPRWQRTLPLVLGFIVFEDLLRRLIPGQPFHIILLKDVVIGIGYVSYLGWILRRGGAKLKLWTPPFLPALGLFAVWLVGLALLNPYGPFVSLVGLRTYLWYVPLIWLTRDALRSYEDLRSLLRPFVYLAIPIALLGVGQLVFWDGLPTFLRPLEGAHTRHSFQLGPGVPLPSSTFGSHFRYGNVSLFMLLTGMALLWTSRSRRRRTWLVLSTASAAVSLLVASSRGAAVMGVLGVSLLVLLGLSKAAVFGRRWIRRVVAGAAVSLVGMAAIIVVVPEALFFSLVSGMEAGAYYPGHIFRVLPVALQTAGAFGAGLGITTWSPRYSLTGTEAVVEFQGRFYGPGGMGIEVGAGKLIWETGIPGLLLFYFFIVTIAWAVVRAVIRTRSSLRVHSYAFAIYAASIFILFHKGGQYLVDPTTSILFWLSIGFVFAVARLNRRPGPSAGASWTVRVPAGNTGVEGQEEA